MRTKVFLARILEKQGLGGTPAEELHLANSLFHTEPGQLWKILRGGGSRNQQLIHLHPVQVQEVAVATSSLGM